MQSPAPPFPGPFLIWIGFACLAGCLQTAAAQQPAAKTAGYPSRDIRLIVPFPPGGGNDVVARIVAGKLQQVLRREVVVDNRGAAGGTAGTDMAAKAPPDGHTLLINNISLAVNATLFAKLPYDTEKDLAAVSLLGRQASVLLVRPDLQAKSVRELLELARKKPGNLIYGSGGPGSSAHLAAERLMLASGTKMTHVPYKGLAQAVDDLEKGKLDLVMATTSTALPALKGGGVRVLAVTTARRSMAFAQVPTMMEAGVPDYEVSTWYALLAPARTPQAVIGRLNTGLRAIGAMPGVREAFAEQGLETAHTSPAQAQAYIKTEIEKWRSVIRAAGIKQQ